MGVGKEPVRNNLRGVGFAVVLPRSRLPKMITPGVLNELDFPSRGAIITGLTSMANGADTAPDGLDMIIPREASTEVK